MFLFKRRDCEVVKILVEGFLIALHAEK
jgi:hypothetical protein